MDFIDLKAQQLRIRDRINEGIRKVLEHGKYILGPEVEELEARLADYVGVRHCISCANGTDALQIAQMALGIGPGDEVITPGFTYIATAETVALLGARPVYVDIDPRTYLLDPAKLEAAITPRTRAIIPVSLYGQCADMDAINAVAGRHGIPVIEDAAQSFGATYRGRRSGSLSSIATTSFFPSKPLGCYGDGGALFTDDDDLAAVLRHPSRTAAITMCASASTAGSTPCRRPSCCPSWRSSTRNCCCARRSPTATDDCSAPRDSRRPMWSVTTPVPTPSTPWKWRTVNWCWRGWTRRAFRPRCTIRSRSTSSRRWPTPVPTCRWVLRPLDG